MRHRWLIALLLVSASGVQAQHAPTDSAYARRIQQDVDSVSLNPRLNQRSKRALLRIDARSDSIIALKPKPDTVVRVDTVRKVDTVYVTKPDTTVPPDTATPPDTTKPKPPGSVLFVHPYAPLPNGTAYAEFPRDTVSLAVPSPTRTIQVVNLQQALDTARTGDLLKIPANNTTSCLLVKETARPSWVTVQGTDSTSVITCGIGGSTSSIGIQSRAHHVRFLGPLSIRTATDATNAIIRSNNGETSYADLAHDFIFDGVTVNSMGFLVRRCAWPDGIRMAIVNSKLLGCASKGGDAQGIIVLNGGGPYRFQGNYIEGGHQCFMSGGGDPSIKDSAPADIYFADNYCFKPYSWHFQGTPPNQTYLGDARQVKTIIETKNIWRALFERNILRNVYEDAQAGFCFLFKSTNQDGSAPNSQTKDVTARYNRCVSVASFVNLAAHPQGGLPMTRVTMYDNIGDSLHTVGGTGICFQILDDVVDTGIMHNTCTMAGNNAISFDGAPGVRTAIVSNIIANGQYGVKGNSTGIGNPTINKWVLPSGLFQNNTIMGADCSVYPIGTTCRLPAPPGVGADTTRIPR